MTTERRIDLGVIQRDDIGIKGVLGHTREMLIEGDLVPTAFRVVGHSDGRIGQGSFRTRSRVGAGVLFLEILARPRHACYLRSIPYKMQPMTSAMQRHRMLGSFTRSRLLQLLHESAEPLGVRDLASALDLHPNTVREHLDQLIEAGLVTRSTERSASRGRPRLGYVAREVMDDSDLAAYRALAAALATQLAGLPDASAAAVAAGRRWGQTLVGDPPSPLTEGDAIKRLAGHLDDVGFDPDLPARPGDPIGLRHCPFESLARERRDITCGVHLGLMRGVLDGLGSSVDVVALEPFVTPNLCLAHLGARVEG